MLTGAEVRVDWNVFQIPWSERVFYHIETTPWLEMHLSARTERESAQRRHYFFLPSHDDAPSPHIWPHEADAFTSNLLRCRWKTGTGGSVLGSEGDWSALEDHQPTFQTMRVSQKGSFCRPNRSPVHVAPCGVGDGLRTLKPVTAFKPKRPECPVGFCLV